MYLEAKETARLYQLLSEKLGNDTTEAMFKYIDNKTERSVEATIKSLATKDDIAQVRREIADGRVEKHPVDVYFLDRPGGFYFGYSFFVFKEVEDY